MQRLEEKQNLKNATLKKMIWLEKKEEEQSDLVQHRRRRFGWRSKKNIAILVGDLVLVDDLIFGD